MEQSQELHPVEVLILVALVAGWAVLVLARAVMVPLLAVPLVLAGWKPRPAPAAPDAPQPAAERIQATPTDAAIHPAGLIALELAQLPVTTLRAMAGVRSKAIRKHDLIVRLAACS